MPGVFENDVKAEATKQNLLICNLCCMFENDVKAKGTKLTSLMTVVGISLRMM